MNGRHHKTAGQEWYHRRKYAPSLGYSAPYSGSAGQNLYPGHAAYTGLTLQADGAEGINPSEENDWITTDLQNTGNRSGDLADRFLQDKTEGLQQRIDRIQDQLETRRQLREQNIYRIDLRMMKSKSKLFECYHWAPGSNQMIERRKSDLQKQLQQMEKEKRLEQVASWRDRQMLLKELRELTDDYRAAQRRKSLLNDTYAPLTGRYIK